MTGDKKINFGWVIVAYGVLCMLVLHYGTIGSQAIFLLPITKDLGVSTTTLTLASTYSTIVSFIVTPIAGKLMNDKSLKKLFIDRKIPAAMRERIPVLCDERGVLGVYSIGVHADRAAGELPAVTVHFDVDIPESSDD